MVHGLTFFSFSLIVLILCLFIITYYFIIYMYCVSYCYCVTKQCLVCALIIQDALFENKKLDCDSLLSSLQ